MLSFLAVVLLLLVLYLAATSPAAQEQSALVSGWWRLLAFYLGCAKNGIGRHTYTVLLAKKYIRGHQVAVWRMFSHLALGRLKMLGCLLVPWMVQ
mmetsp:Transcript_36836/g.72330  ORF Transcript_36836/g.72330 Transcript_36836/m.72330 type:complete len:95 (-) Transcript_36836:201-485(-)